MIQPAPGIVIFTDSGSTIAIHPIITEIGHFHIDGKHRISNMLTFYMNVPIGDKGGVAQTANINITTSSLEKLHEGIGHYLEQIKEKEARDAEQESQSSED
ncbi:MAG: hypothetical protein H8D23_16690 [Candidatus Brocadiales bacterium]|nr:hypothetical protein [Candidatus Brocadiales bacterium]